MTVLYNEIDPYAAQWLRNLISRGLIAPGDVAECSIEDLRPADLRHYSQVHFFAGIGVWSYALRRAGIGDDVNVWTGSCPCQPFSAAGKGGGFADERHLWPHFHYLIEQCRPVRILGEQVASKDGLAWLDLVQSDLEGTGYTVGSVDSCSAGFGAPHIRQRLYWMGVADSAGSQSGRQRSATMGHRRPVDAASGIGELAYSHDARSQGWTGVSERADQCASGSLGVVGKLADANGGNAGAERLQRSGQHGQQPENSGARIVADASTGGRREERADAGRLDARDGAQGFTAGLGASGGDLRPGPTNGLWASCDWIFCRDGKWRPVEPGTFPLAHGAPARVGRLRAYGNAINAEQATAFCEVVKEAACL